MIAGYPLKQIVNSKVTRFIRPKLSINTDTQNSLVSHTLNNQMLDEIACSNDISEPSSGFDTMLTFPTEFGYLIKH